MAEPFTVGAIVTAAILLRPSAREHERLKTIAYMASKLHKSPEAARSAFFEMANANDQGRNINRVESLPPAHVRPASPAQVPDNFVQNPMSVVPETFPQLARDDNSDPSPTAQPVGQQSLLPPFLPKHCRETIDKKWMAKRAIEDAQYQKDCDKLSHKHISTEARRSKQQQRLDDKHRRGIKALELKRCIEISMGEWRARQKAEKHQKKASKSEPTPPAQMQVGTDGAAEQSDEGRSITTGLSSHYESSDDSSSDEIFALTLTGWQPTTLMMAGIAASSI